jgi:putative ABC transport system permease protein
MRSVLRQPMKSGLSVLGIACATSLLVTGNSLMDSMNFGIGIQFQRVHREDATLSLVEPRNRALAATEIAHLPGVRTVEPFRNVAVRLRSGHRSRRVSLEGLPAGRTLGQLLDADLEPVEIPDHGLLLSEKLAEILDVGVGDRVRVEVLEGARPVREIPVVATIETYFGMGAYLDIGALSRLVGEGPAMTGALIAFDPAIGNILPDQLKETPAVAGMGLRSEMIRSFEDTAKKSFAVMSFFTYSFALVIAFGVVYNNARIILAERSRELASLRVLGYRRREISEILLGEIGLLTVLGIPLGHLIGVGLATLLLTSFDSELYRMPVVIEPKTFAKATLTILIASTIAGLWVRRHLDRLDLVAVLKTRE